MTDRTIRISSDEKDGHVISVDEKDGHPVIIGSPADAVAGLAELARRRLRLALSDEEARRVR